MSGGLEGAVGARDVMPELAARESATRTAEAASIGDFIKLMKPGVMSLVVFTALTGMVVAPGHLHPALAGIALMCIAVGAGAAGALNMWYDADIDALMQRTAARPIPRGSIAPAEALAFGVILAFLSIATLGLLVNWTAAALLASTIAFYVFVYTMLLKRRTPQNIVIGGAAGATAPMIGWASATGVVSIESLLLSLIIFVWTPPHFWALALYRARDYARACVPMLPVVAGLEATRRQIGAYSIVLVLVSPLPCLVALAGPFYLATAATLGAVFLALTLKVLRTREGRSADRAAKRLFGFSILYLFGLFAALLLERGVVLWLG